MPELPPPDESRLTLDAGRVEQLEVAWRAWRPGQQAPRWDDLLPGPGESCGPDGVFYLVQLDIECRVKAGLPALLAEPYFLHPRIRQDDGRQVELIRWEY